MPKCLNSSFCALAMMAFGFLILFERHPLFVPANGFGLFYQRGDHASERPHFLRQLICWFVILIDTHTSLFCARR